MTFQKRILTGVKPTGIPHLGNYLGAIQPILKLASKSDVEVFCFIPDAHALTSPSSDLDIREHTRILAATWLALGFDPQKIYFYRQSHVQDVFELFWILSCLCPKGLMNRAHSYKALRAKNETLGEADKDVGVLMGTYSYPILMAADILLFQATDIPVGKDQIQHVEMARDLAVKFNQTFGETFTLPKARVSEGTATLPGLDGQKMSKSYGNTIPLFLEKDKLWKLIKKIKTNSQPPEEPKTTEGCTLFQIFSSIAPSEETQALREDYAEGIGWGEVKKRLLEALEVHFADARERFQTLMAHPEKLEVALKAGEERARQTASLTMKLVRQRVGF